MIDGASVSLCRQRAGRFLAKEHPVDADIVIGVPDSGLEAAIGYSYESGIPYAIGFTKGNTELKEAVNEALAELIADGTVQAIVDKYIPAE